MSQSITLQVKLELCPDSLALLHRLEALSGAIDIKQALALADDIRTIRELLQTEVALAGFSSRSVL